jgi:mycoredoxin
MTENGVVVYGTSGCGDCHPAKKALKRRGVNYAWVDVGKAKWAREEMLRLNGDARRVPTLLFPGGIVLVEPTPPELNARLDEQAP